MKIFLIIMATEFHFVPINFEFGYQYSLNENFSSFNFSLRLLRTDFKVKEDVFSISIVKCGAPGAPYISLLPLRCMSKHFYVEIEPFSWYWIEPFEGSRCPSLTAGIFNKFNLGKKAFLSVLPYANFRMLYDIEYGETFLWFFSIGVEFVQVPEQKIKMWQFLS